MAREQPTPESARIHQVTQERHGWWLLLLLSVIVIPVELLRLSLAITADRSWFRWVLGIAFPLLIVRQVIALWLGEFGGLRTLAWLLLLRAGQYLTSLVAMLRLPLVMDEIPLIAGLLRSVMQLSAAGLVVFGLLSLMCFASSSLKAFVLLRFRTNGLYRWVPDRLRSLLGEPSINERIFSEYRQLGAQGPYTQFTPALIDALEEGELEEAIVDYAVAAENAAGERDPRDVFRELPPGFATVYTLWELQAQVDNGGFFQFFVNRGLPFALLTLESCQQVGREDMRLLLARAIDRALEHEDSVDTAAAALQDVTQLTTGGWADAYLNGEKEISLDDLSSEFYELDPIDLDQFIRLNMSLFQSTSARTAADEHPGTESV
ncbi:MAG: DMP19 family protein [Planctomycetaceae bacterium]|nr:DMP19 family protein [Planctomycetaceae bacterium]